MKSILMARSIELENQINAAIQSAQTNQNLINQITVSAQCVDDDGDSCGGKNFTFLRLIMDI